MLTANFQNSESHKFQDELGETVLACVSKIPEGVLCFFPSYSLMDKMHQRWQASGLWKRLSTVKQLFVEPR